MVLENIMLSKISQTQEAKVHVFSHICKVERKNEKKYGWASLDNHNGKMEEREQ